MSNKWNCLKMRSRRGLSDSMCSFAHDLGCSVYNFFATEIYFVLGIIVKETVYIPLIFL